jgi:hypothetical protein
MLEDKPLQPIPSRPIANLVVAIMFWAAVIGLAFPAWRIGAPWGGFVYVGTIILMMLFVELRQLTNALIRTLPTLRQLRDEVAHLRAQLGNQVGTELGRPVRTELGQQA